MCNYHAAICCAAAGRRPVVSGGACIAPAQPSQPCNLVPARLQLQQAGCEGMQSLDRTVSTCNIGSS